jgi:hypothetical protein
MNPTEKIAPLSLLTRQDQVSLYMEEQGRDAAMRQTYFAMRRNGELCVCDPVWVTDFWRGPDRGPSHRLIHAFGCPRRKRWMQRERLFT